ncbi:VWA domain-containing protein [Thiothrix nivea]|uniref:VWA containing CoxE family protein n=1 Tax=Thiothrix nivea (strain ATCC 35100 / DSM 5205 / JP2) TaxID=870187 RepID=A0A656HH97_THINJ|nr:VWA domain-containing protein [Thiothrix nivea]EIJ34750.1 VWA containing CoxE family protein [Thiothrix nivea DSM 5205]
MTAWHELSARQRQTLSRWRLILGPDAEQEHIRTDDRHSTQQAAVLDYLFADQPRKRGAGNGKSTFTIPQWITAVDELFPRQVKEVLERELIARRGIEQLLKEPDLLEKVEPNVELVKTILTFKNLLNEDTRILARKVIEKVVNELKDKIKQEIIHGITGAINRNRHAPAKVFRNLDLKTTLRRNLHNWDAQQRKLIVDQTYFYASERKQRPWHIIIAVDQSGSMLESAVFSTIMASIFHELPAVRTSLFLFDTQIADLSGQVGQPVDVLLKVQLGGGTNIALAMQYALQLIREPRRTIVVLITDFYEGGSQQTLLETTRAITLGGSRCIGLAALGYGGRAAYDRTLASKMAKQGMDILTTTPEQLSACIAQIMRS